MKNDARRSRLAQRILALRSLRHELFSSDLYADHAWSMLLTIFVAESENEVIAAVELFRRADVLPSVGARWLAYLEKSGLVSVTADRADVTLTAEAAKSMRSFLDRCTDVADERVWRGEGR